MVTATSYVKSIAAEMIAGKIIFALHEFKKGDDGSLVHLTDGTLRATVPPEGWQDYVAQWPQCEPVVAYLHSGAKTLSIPEQVSEVTNELQSAETVSANAGGAPLNITPELRSLILGLADSLKGGQ